MIGAALYLSRRSFANALRRRIQRLRQPKYLIGFCVGLLYFYWLIARPGGGVRGGGRAVGGPFAGGVPGAGLGDVAAVAGLAVMVLLTWIFGSAETPFTFQLAETDFLFPAPLTRRQVIQFRLLRTQVPLLISAAFSVLIFSRTRFDALLPLRIVGLWLVYLTLQLHTAGAALVRGSLSQQGLTGLRRRLITLGVLAALVAGLWLGLRASLPGVLAAWSEDSGAGAAQLVRVLHHGVLGVVLWPLFALKGPLLAASATQFLQRLPAALLVAAAHYVWVVRSTLAFEEAAVEHAGKVARRLEARRRGRDVPVGGARGAPRVLVPLAASGPPVAAIVWKNATGALREFRLRTLVLIGVLVVAMGSALGGGSRGGAANLIAILALALCGVALVFGPLTLRYDLRRDLELLDVMKTYPVRGFELVAAEVLGPVLLLSAVTALGVCLAFVASLASHSPLPAVGDRVALLIGILPAIPAVFTVLLLVQNAAALLFPAWSAIGPERATGFEATGQRILSFIGTAFALLVAVLPAAVAGGLVAVLARALGAAPFWAAALWAVVGAVMLVVESYVVVRLLGPVWEKLEPAGLR
ncbi:MAG TPA: putative ABC exporter domain-containing protein [Gemmatimonadales bacterium]|nr:putative ABC exporter domain-containing protein [Gemmatimonadales bacterium]